MVVGRDFISVGVHLKWGEKNSFEGAAGTENDFFFFFFFLEFERVFSCDRCEEGSYLQDVEGSVSESRGRDDDESDSDDMQRHVEFTILEDTDYEGGGDSGKPNRLHRRDTPHHLKNKRIHTSIDKDKVASIIAQVSN